MTTIATTRPRDVNSWRAAGILYGDWGTSKAYVLGLAFALAGHSSFWFILAVSILIMLVGINYLTICKFYPFGGGVYASVRKRSKVLSFCWRFLSNCRLYCDCCAECFIRLSLFGSASSRALGNLWDFCYRSP